jgi:hypothetical protein
MRTASYTRTGRLAGTAAALLALATLTAGWPADASAAPAATQPLAVAGHQAASQPLAPPWHQGTLRITGEFRDGATVTAAGLAWHAPSLPAGTKLLSFEVASTWQSCAMNGQHCVSAADSTATPFAASTYRVGHADTGRRLRVTQTAAEVVETQPSTFTFQVIRRSVSLLAGAAVGGYRLHQRPAAEFVNGTPQRQTASAQEYFQVSSPHYATADGQPGQLYRIDSGPWRTMPGNRVFYTGTLRPGPHRVAVRTANRAGSTVIQFRWQVTPLPAPVACRSSWRHRCWYPPHLGADHRPMRWDWQIGRVTPLQRTGASAVDIYDIDGFLTTGAQVSAIRSGWQASTLKHPRTVCYLDLAWKDYRPDASPAPRGSYFPAATLGAVYNGYPEERWLDFRQLDALKPMLRERIGMCARKGFDAVELDDIDSFDPPSTTGFQLTPGDAENFLAYAFNEIHRYGMTGLWKNSPYLSWWGRQYSDGAVVEECYLSHGCLAAQLRGSRQYGITCTVLHGSTPCGWDDFSSDTGPRQPTGKWVGEAEYADDDYVCDPGQRCPHEREFATFCQAVYLPRDGFTAVKFDAGLDSKTFYPCPQGH